MFVPTYMYLQVLIHCAYQHMTGGRVLHVLVIGDEQSPNPEWVNTAPRYGAQPYEPPPKIIVRLRRSCMSVYVPPTALI